MNITDIANRLGFEFPVAYISLYHSGMLPQEYDPKTICVLNLRMASLLNSDEVKDKLFINEDGLGNYYFIWLNSNDSNVYLLSHDPKGVESTGRNLYEFVNEYEQQDIIIHYVAPGELAICKTSITGESILNPIALDEWKEAISKFHQIEYVGYREIRNPFTGAIFKMDVPGYSLIQINGVTYKFKLIDGRVMVTGDNQVLTSLCERLAIELGASVYACS